MKESHHEIRAGWPPLAATPAFAPSGAPALTFDIEAYRKFVADAGLSQEQEDEFLAALWEVVVAFVDMGFEIHPVQQAKATNPLAVDSASVVISDNSKHKNDFAMAALDCGA